MKLALVRQRFTWHGGAELYVSRLARRLVEQGRQVHVLARSWEDDGPEGLVFRRLKYVNRPTFVRLHSFGRAVERAVAEGGYDLVHSFERTWSQDIFRAGDGCHRQWLARRAQALGPGRVGLDRINPRHRAFLDVETKLFHSPRLKLVLVNSRGTAEEISHHYGLPDEMFRLVYNGLDRNRFHPGLAGQYREETRRELGLTSDEPALLFVGSGFVRKGLQELLRALPAVKGRLLAAGRDRLGPFRRLAQKLGVGDRAVFLGPRPDVERLYGAADVFVLPSWYEPFSNACLEAMASGLPVVTTTGTGAAEVIEDGVNGFVVPFPARPEILAEKITQALALDRERLIDANRLILAPFDWNENLRLTLAAYDEVLNKRD